MILQTILQSIDKFVSIENKQIIVDHRTQIAVQSTPLGITPLCIQVCLWVCVFVECTYLENIEHNAPQRLEEMLTRLRRSQLSKPVDIPQKGGTGVRKYKRLETRSEIVFN